MQKNNLGFINIILIVAIAIALLGAGAYFVVNQQMLPWLNNSVVTPTPNPVACTQEAKLCPDGSSVGRSGPNCEFAQCPEANPTPKPNSTSYNKDGTCPTGYVNYGVPLQCVTPEYMEGCKTHPCPICLAENTLIETPNGKVPVELLKVGMPIWTVDKLGNKISATIIKTSKTPVPNTHQMVHIVLKDKREIFASPGHPTTDGRIFNDLSLGDTLDGSIIVTAEKVSYDKGYTYDVLPFGETGFYFANGILIDSTLH